MTIPARPFYRHSDFEGALFADAFFGSLCRMAVAAIGIVCADSHYGGVLPFQPLFAPGHVCTGKERCRKKEGHTCWSTAPEFRPRNITYFIFKCSFGSNPPINVPSCPDGKKPTPILISRLSHVSSIVFRVDFQIAIRMVAVQTDAKLRPAPQIPHSEPTWQIHHTCRIIKTAGCLSYSKAQLAHIGSLATAFSTETLVSRSLPSIAHMTNPLYFHPGL